MEVISSDFAENECKIWDKKEVSTAADLELCVTKFLTWYNMKPYMVEKIL